VLEEGVGEQVQIIAIVLSQISLEKLVMKVDVFGGEDLAVGVRPNNVTILPNSSGVNVYLIYMGNEISLEDNITVVLSLASNETGVLIGGPLHEHMTVYILDDDHLHIGFTDNMLSFKSSERTGSIRVNITTGVKRNVVILIRFNDTLSPNMAQPHELLFGTDDDKSKIFEFELGEEHDRTVVVMITLEVATYPQSLHRVRDKIIVGQYPGLHREAVIIVRGENGDDDANNLSVSQSAMIGIICSVVIAVTVILLIIYLYFRLCGKDRSSVRSSGQDSEGHVDMVEVSKFAEVMEKVDSKEN